MWSQLRQWMSFKGISHCSLIFDSCRNIHKRLWHFPHNWLIKRENWGKFLFAFQTIAVDYRISLHSTISLIAYRSLFVFAKNLWGKNIQFKLLLKGEKEIKFLKCTFISFLSHQFSHLKQQFSTFFFHFLHSNLLWLFSFF